MDHFAHLRHFPGFWTHWQGVSTEPAKQTPRMYTILKTSCTRWSALLLATMSLHGATEGSSATNTTTTTNAPKFAVAGYVAPTNAARPPIETSAFRAQLVMVDHWGEKFAVEHEGKVHQFKMAHGGILFRKGKPTTLDSFAVGQDVILMVLHHPSGRLDLLSASTAPRLQPVQAAGRVEKTVQDQSEYDAKAQKQAEKEARRQAKAEAKAQAQAEEEAQERAEAEAKAQKQAEKEARKQREAAAEAEAEAQENAEKEAAKRAKAEAKAQEAAEEQAAEQAKAEAKARKAAEKEARKKAEADAEAQKEAQEQAEKEAAKRAKAEAKAQKEAEKEAAKRAKEEAKAREKAEKEAAKAAKKNGGQPQN